MQQRHCSQEFFRQDKIISKKELGYTYIRVRAVYLIVEPEIKEQRLESYLDRIKQNKINKLLTETQQRTAIPKTIRLD